MSQHRHPVRRPGSIGTPSDGRAASAPRQTVRVSRSPPEHARAVLARLGTRGPRGPLRHPVEVAVDVVDQGNDKKFRVSCAPQAWEERVLRPGSFLLDVGRHVGEPYVPGKDEGE